MRGPKATSPPAKTPGAVVLRFSSILRMPRGVTCTPSSVSRIGKVSLLADGENHAVAGNDLFLVAEGRIEAAVLVEDARRSANLQTSNHAVFANHFLRPPAVIDHDAFVLGLFHFAFPRRHLGAGFEADHVRLLRRRSAWRRAPHPMPAAGSFLLRRGARKSTASCTRRTAARATSMATLPPPTTATRLPSSISNPRLTLMRKSMPL